MPHTTPNIPTSQPDNRKTSTINETMKAAKGNANTSFGAGIAANSTSSGNSAALDETVQERSFWAMLTRRLRFYNTPPNAWIRIPHDQKPRDKDGKITRDPWESYDGYGFNRTPSNIRYAPVINGIKIGKDIELGMPQGNNNEGRFTRYGPPGTHYTLEGAKGEPNNLLPGLGSDPNDPGMWDTGGYYNKYYWAGPDSRYLTSGSDMGGGLDNGGGNSIQFGPNGEWYRGFCPHYFWCYGWCEIIENLDFNRLGHYWCEVETRDATSAIPFYANRRYEKSRTEPGEKEPWPSPDPNEKEFAEGAFPDTKYLNRPFECREHLVPKEHQSHGGLWGSAMGPSVAHEINNCSANPGDIVRMYKGKGDYYLFSGNMGVSAKPESVTNQVKMNMGTGYDKRINRNAPWMFWADAWHINRSF